MQSLAPGDSLVDSFAYSLIDAAGAESNLVTVALNVDGINDAPILGLDTPQLDPDGTTSIPVLDNDTDVDGIDQSGHDPSRACNPRSVRSRSSPTERSSTRRSPASAHEDIFSYTVADNLGLRKRTGVRHDLSQRQPDCRE